MLNFPKDTEQEIRITYMAHGLPFTGAEVTLTLYSPTGAMLLDAVPAYEEENGIYYKELASTILAIKGIYRAVWRAQKLVACCIYHEQILEKEDYFSVGYLAQGEKPTKQEVRWMVAKMLGDDFVSQAESGSLQSFNDKFLYTWPLNNLDGGWVYVFAGTNTGERSRRINSIEDAVMVVAPAYSTEIDSTSRYEAHRRYSTEEYNNAIEMAIRLVIDYAFIEVSDDSFVVPSVDSPTIDLPNNFTHISGLWVNITDNFPQEQSPRSWEVIPGKRKLQIAERICTNYVGKVLRIDGLVKPTIPLSDYETIDIPIAYIVAKAASILLGSRMGSANTDSGDHKQQKAIAEQDAMNARSLIRVEMPPNSKKVS